MESHAAISRARPEPAFGTVMSSISEPRGWQFALKLTF